MLRISTACQSSHLHSAHPCIFQFPPSLPLTRVVCVLPGVDVVRQRSPPPEAGGERGAAAVAGAGATLQLVCQGQRRAALVVLGRLRLERGRRQRSVRAERREAVEIGGVENTLL